MFITITFWCILTLNEANWSMFGGDSSHTGYKDIELLINGDYSILLWNKTLPHQLTYATVSNNHYYTIGYDDHSKLSSLYVLNANNGDILKIIPTANGSHRGTPIITDNEQIITNIVDVNDYIYIDSYSINNNYQHLWQKKANVYFAEYPYGVTTSHNFMYFAGGRWDDIIYGINLIDGSQLFNVSIPTGVYNAGYYYWAPTVYKGRVFINQPIYLTEIDKNTGHVLWTKTFDSYQNGDPWYTHFTASISNNVSIVITGTTANHVNIRINAIELDSHQIIWSHAIPKPYFSWNTFSGMFEDYTASTDGVNAFITSRDGIMSYDLFDGVLSAYYNCTNCAGQPIITNDCIIINSEDGVQIFDKYTRELIDILDATGMIALDGNRLYVTNKEDGTIQAYLFNNVTTALPTLYPTASPTSAPTSETLSPTAAPSFSPTLPTSSPTWSPTSRTLSPTSPTPYPTNPWDAPKEEEKAGINWGLIIGVAVGIIVTGTIWRCIMMRKSRLKKEIVVMNEDEDIKIVQQSLTSKPSDGVDNIKIVPQSNDVDNIKIVQQSLTSKPSDGVDNIKIVPQSTSNTASNDVDNIKIVQQSDGIDDDYQIWFKTKLNDTRINCGCTCCNLWMAVHIWLIVYIIFYFLQILIFVLIVGDYNWMSILTFLIRSILNLCVNLLCFVGLYQCKSYPFLFKLICLAIDVGFAMIVILLVNIFAIIHVLLTFYAAWVFWKIWKWAQYFENGGKYDENMIAVPTQ